MFYSNTLFAGLGMSTATITGLVGIVNFVATFGGLYLLTVAGRRTIMLWNNLLMAILLVLQGYFCLHGYNYAAIASTMLFIASFEFSSGPITWLYMAEIM